MVFAADLLRERAKGLCGELVVAGSVHEECFEGVGSESIARMTNPDYVVIGEASGLDLKRGQRGHLRENNETVNRQQKRGYVPPFFVAYLLLARDSRFLVNTVHQICSDNFFHLRPYYFPYMFGYTI